MSKRLHDIWSGFEELTERRLWGRGVDKIVVPSRTDLGADDEQLLPDEFDAPAKVAFEALHEQLETKRKKFGGRKKSRSMKGEDKAPEMSLAEENEATRMLLQDLQSTAMRTDRSEMDYGSFLATDGAKSLQSLKRRGPRLNFSLFKKKS